MLKLDAEWKERLRAQEEKYNSRERHTDEELNQTVDNVKKLFKTSGKSEICSDERQAVMNCYQQNSGQALNCKKTVKSFVSCVNTQRVQTLKPGG